TMAMERSTSADGMAAALLLRMASANAAALQSAQGTQYEHVPASEALTSIETSEQTASSEQPEAPPNRALPNRAAFADPIADATQPARALSFVCPPTMQPARAAARPEARTEAVVESSVGDQAEPGADAVQRADVVLADVMPPLTRMTLEPPFIAQQ